MTIIPNITPAMPFDNLPYEGGVLLIGWAIRWTDIIENARTAAEMRRKVRQGFTRDWYSLLNHFPVIDLDEKILGKQILY